MKRAVAAIAAEAEWFAHRAARARRRHPRRPPCRGEWHALALCKALLERRRPSGPVDEITADGVQRGIVLHEECSARQVVIEVVAEGPNGVRLTRADIWAFYAMRRAAGAPMSKWRTGRR